MANTNKKDFLKYQQEEIDGSEIYFALSHQTKSEENKKILQELSYVERDHAAYIQKFTGVEVKPNNLKVFFYHLISVVFGLTFALKIMERGEELTSLTYKDCPELEHFSAVEEKHEHQLLELINEKWLDYMGSIVLGLNDALVEFTGALAGFTLALSNTKVIALTASITAIAGALSMASSEYLSNKADMDENKHPLSAAISTGSAFFLTVLALILPFIILNNAITALITMLVIAVLIIAVFNFYYTTVRGESFRKRFAEMTIISFSIATVSFLIGYLLKLFTGIDI
jgi:VIT1/CCC1 family predicted Fe2+/Mn2+ transporter